MLDEARRRLGEVTKDQAKYAEVLLTLIVQGLFQIMEPNTLIKTRQVDQELVQSLLPKAVEQYKEKMGKDVSLKLDTTSFLGADTCGGVELSALNGRIRVSDVVFFLCFLYCIRQCPLISVNLIDIKMETHCWVGWTFY